MTYHPGLSTLPPTCNEEDRLGSVAEAPVNRVHQPGSKVELARGAFEQPQVMRWIELAETELYAPAE